MSKMSWKTFSATIIVWLFDEPKVALLGSHIDYFSMNCIHCKEELFKKGSNVTETPCIAPSRIKERDITGKNKRKFSLTCQGQFSVFKFIFFKVMNGMRPDRVKSTSDSDLATPKTYRNVHLV